MQIVYRAESQKSSKGPEQWFTGDVQVDPLFPDNETARYSGAYVTFQPGARTAWHLHPAGQHIIVISGVGLTSTRDGNILEFKTGDTVWCPPQNRPLARRHAQLSYKTSGHYGCARRQKRGLEGKGH